MKITLLGVLSLNSGDLDITPTAPKQRELLGLLLLKANQVVSFDSLVQELWEGSPPSDAVATMHAHMSQLRKVLHQRSDTHRLRTHERGYLFTASWANSTCTRPSGTSG